MKERNWRDYNRANWDERVKLHLRIESYDLGPLRSGHGKLTPIQEMEIGPVEGMRILHLQCHFGRDTLAFAQRGATVVGVDFSVPAVDAARALAEHDDLRVDSPPRRNCYEPVSCWTFAQMVARA